MITVSEEHAIDYGLTARLATEAFASPTVHFTPERTRWLYERSFGGTTMVVAAFDDGKKIGQVALIGQTLCIDGERFSAIQLVDLFVVKPHRSSQLVRRLYREVERLCRDRGIRYILALPNEQSALLNARLLKLEAHLTLPARIGVSLPWPVPSRVRHSGAFKAMSKETAIALFGECCPSVDNGLRWDAETLFARLSDPSRDYGVHATETALLISSSRKIRGLACTVLCAFLARPQAAIGKPELRRLVRAACRFWKAPLFVFAGINGHLASLPGLPLPARLRRPILIQLRDLESEHPAVRLERFQLIDSDFA